MTPLQGLILTGGQSKRMGQDKALMRSGSRTQLEQSYDLLQAQLSSVYVSIKASQVNDPVRSQYRLIMDAQNCSGPMAGILSAHKTYPDCAWLVIACDMPFLNSETLMQLIKARDNAYDATVFSNPDDSLPEPLCAIYEPNALVRVASDPTRLPSNSARDLLRQSRIKMIEAKNPYALENTNYSR
ncbi:MAG TPA: NTP transferase domain-containing protein [Gammaproteobacteria bacterium]|jgi:molybdopterin-guanine dinucleotide biosynthesis protein A|nr:NTP transferase domain-containing protein [Gammaproteobacteria bacterium]HJP42472.1 NTP transferase domain-containing protein [Gammaproteobacteria bacterium]|tara:strand:- start:835 stop:1389 length:555 start_codon:yes stop_codon:yes gene_type:complete